MKHITSALLSVSCLLLIVAAASAADLNTTIQESTSATEESRKAQATIDQLADDASLMLQEYRSTLEQTDSLKTYNNQFEKLVAKQTETLASINAQMDSVEDTQRNIVPLMLRMIDVLEQFIALDMPFLQEERQARLQIIKDMMDRPDVTLPDKYRRIMEAYQIEMDYGRTINTNNQIITQDGKNYTVDVLRIGRLALFYQSLDGSQSGYWDKAGKRWAPLSDEYNSSIAEGILIARKQSPPDLFKIPVPAPERAP